MNEYCNECGQTGSHFEFCSYFVSEQDARIAQLERDLACDRHALGVASSEIQRLGKTNVTHKEHITMVEKHRQEAVDKAGALAKDKVLLVDALYKAPVGNCGCGTKTPQWEYHNKFCVVFVAGQALSKVADSKECEHGKGLTDYCQPCGRVNGG